MIKQLRKLCIGCMLVAACGLFFGPAAQAADYDKPIKLGWTAWSTAEANVKLIKKILEDKMGYDVELIMSDIGIQYQGVANGDIDAMIMSWLPTTQKDYWDRFAKDVVNLGPIYTRARLGWAVPSYIPKDKLNSISDLTNPEVAEKLNNKITGIDPGAGIMQASEKAMDEYGLKDAGYQLLSSSGAGMTAALARAVKRDEWIVVTGWSPHWKFAKWDLRYLEDPKGLLGGKERVHCLVRKGFYQDVPYEVFEFFVRYNIPIDDLEQLMLEARNSSYEEAVDAYIENNPKRIHYWMTGELK
ncbi:glycine betaine ABC transporter substrate-binding protein [Desulfovermiculus halophilus]|uniref:glycine betaine ABC transporter substrate-binding protein n=1 Tax=Desulfovermiculus halophilus TaxID=339722 RepID=UPI0004848D55|nr:glycine betaine ABC transporter substrate-binding protein [Desulfovermiculus halophilus]